MAYPIIDESRPYGSQFVSMIDDAERQTRRWLKQCMQEISGYPTISTVAIKGWTSSARPSGNPSSNYLLGLNIDTNNLELIKPNGQLIEILSDETRKSIALLAHPVGSYYETNNVEFDPNSEWGGTWERLQDGRVLVSNCDGYLVGATGGEETVTLTTEQIPTHSHKHTHELGTLQVIGSFSDTGNSSHTAGFRAARMTESTFNGEGAVSGEIEENAKETGGGQEHNNMPPYLVVIRWHRTA